MKKKFFISGNLTIGLDIIWITETEIQSDVGMKNNVIFRVIRLRTTSHK